MGGEGGKKSVLNDIVVFSLLFLWVLLELAISHISLKRIETYIRYTDSPKNAVSTSATNGVITDPREGSIRKAFGSRFQPR